MVSVTSRITQDETHDYRLGIADDNSGSTSEGIALRGLSARGGHVSPQVRKQVIRLILDESKDLSEMDQAMLLAIAEAESGFNPDAKATTTSASGIFQLIKATGEALGVFGADVFNAHKNIKAGVKLYLEHQALVRNRYPKESSETKLALLYALHHDGPSLNFGGLDIAYKRVIPRVSYWLKHLQKLTPFSDKSR